MTATHTSFWHYTPGAPFTPDISLPAMLCALPLEEVSDEVLRASAAEALQHTAVIADQPIVCTATAGTIELSGTVEWYHQRAEAEQAVRYLPGAAHVLNRIHVDKAQ